MEESNMAELYVHLRNWLQREEGQDLAEYALLIGLIALVVIVAVTLLGENLSVLFSQLGSEVGTWFP
jgi:pilus assembly protein Flp/PilA